MLRIREKMSIELISRKEDNREVKICKKKERNKKINFLNLAQIEIICTHTHIFT